MLKEIADLGFEYAELSHGINLYLVSGIMKALSEGWIKISSVHNFCPLPVGVSRAAPNLYLPTAVDSRERGLWLRATEKTVDFALEVGAHYAVLHCGSFPYFWKPADRSLKKYIKGKDLKDLRGDPKLRNLVNKALAKLAPKTSPTRARLLGSLQEIVDYVEEEGKRLGLNFPRPLTFGLENREDISEFPADRDMSELQAIVPEGHFAYWHDSGHAQIKELLGAYSHRRLLEENVECLGGWHLQDVTADGHPHQALGCEGGTIDWDMVKKFFRPDQTFVLELGPGVEREEVLQSKVILEQLLRSVPDSEPTKSQSAEP